MRLNMPKKKKMWIKGVVSKMKKGALTAQARRAGMTPMAFARKHAGDSGTTGRRARLAIVLRRLSKKK